MIYEHCEHSGADEPRDKFPFTNIIFIAVFVIAVGFALYGIFTN